MEVFCDFWSTGGRESFVGLSPGSRDGIKTVSTRISFEEHYYNLAGVVLGFILYVQLLEVGTE